MTMTQRNYLTGNIAGYGHWVKQKIDEGYKGHLMTLMFNQMHGCSKQMNHQKHIQVQNAFASLLTRLHRKPFAHGVIHPILIGCPDWPVPKYQKQSRSDVVTNDGLHFHGILLIPPGSSRLKVSVPQHFADNQSFYVRDQVLERIDIKPITHDVHRVTDYV